MLPRAQVTAAPTAGQAEKFGVFRLSYDITNVRHDGSSKNCSRFAFSINMPTCACQNQPKNSCIAGIYYIKASTVRFTSKLRDRRVFSDRACRCFYQLVHRYRPSRSCAGVLPPCTTPETLHYCH